MYNELVFKLLRDRFGEGEAVLFARSSTVNGQRYASRIGSKRQIFHWRCFVRYPVHWGGDCESTWEAMAEALRGLLSLTASGFGYASHDIGGFEVCI
jgi:alpha-glucosidase (family GH31 glycosyl hydrolase)